jgi:hypothetical protein
VRRLSEDRRRVAGVAVVDRACVDRFKQRRPECELDPLHRYALRGEALLKRLARFDQQQDRRLLIADPQFAQRFGAQRRGRERHGEGREKEMSAVHDNP